MEAMMHFHTERTTTDKLGDTLDALAGPDAVKVEPHYLGGRDWVVVAEHGEHGDPVEVPLRLARDLLAFCERQIEAIPADGDADDRLAYRTLGAMHMALTGFVDVLPRLHVYGFADLVSGH